MQSYKFLGFLKASSQIFYNFAANYGRINDYKHAECEGETRGGTAAEVSLAGRRELMHCLEAGYEVVETFMLADQTDLAEQDRLGNILTVSPQVYEKMAYRGSTEGVMAVVREKSLSLEELQLGAAPLIMVLERVEKPGNLGAVLRSADAAKADAVIICDPLTDLYNPNLIRSSIGAIFSVPCVACSSEACIAFLKARGIQILTAQLQDSSLYYDTDMLGGTAIVMGTESTGLTDVWRQAADAHID